MNCSLNIILKYLSIIIFLFLTLTLRANEIDQLPKCKFTKGKLVTTELCKEEQKFEKIRSWYEKELITEEEYKKKFKEIIEETPSLKEIGWHEVIDYPIDMQKKIGTADPLRVAAQEVVFRFVKKKHSLGKYPAKVMEGMAWMEVLYNEKIKNPRANNLEDLEPLLEARNSMRETMGLESELSFQEAIDYYSSMNILLSNADTIKNTLSNDMLERKKVVDEFKSNISKYKNSPQNNSEIKKHIKSYQQKLNNFSETEDSEVQVVDILLKEVNKGLDLVEESLDTNKNEVILSAIELVEAGLDDVASYIPKEKQTTFDNINFEEVLSERQIASLSLTAKDPSFEKQQDVEKIINNIDILHEQGIKSVQYADNVGHSFATRTFANGLVNKRILTNIGTYATYTAVRRLNNLQVEAQIVPWQRTQTLVHRRPVFSLERNWFGALSVRHTANYYTYTPVRVWPQTAVIFDPVFPVITQEDKGPPEFWETEEYKDNFYEAYDRVQWPHLYEDNPLTREEFKKDFPVYPDGYPVGDVYENIVEAAAYKGPPIEWEGLTEDGKCMSKLYWCPEQTEYQLHILKNTPTVVSDYDHLPQFEGNAFVSIDKNINENIDLTNIDNNTIDTSKFTNEVNDINETVSEVTGNLVSNSDSLDSFMEQVDNINDSVSQVTENLNTSLEATDLSNVDKALETFSNTSTLEAFSNTDELTESLNAVQESMNRMAEATEQIKQDLLSQDLNDYLENAAEGQACAMVKKCWSCEYEPVYDC